MKDIDLSQRAPQQVTVKPDEIAKAVYQAMVWVMDQVPGDVPTPTWVEGGNSLAQTEARAAEHRILRALSPRPVTSRGPAAGVGLDKNSEWNYPCFQSQ
jgi:hypothetical protein